MSVIPDIKIQCPKCRAIQAIQTPISSGNLRCLGCGAVYPITEGVIDIMPEYTRSYSQKVMESQRFIGIYETKWFRKGPFMPVIAGLSFEQEYEIITKAAGIEGSRTVLDLGCSTGIYSRPLAKSLGGGAVVGVDLSLPALRNAAMKVKEEGIENLVLIHANALDLPFDANSFDAAISCATIHLFTREDLLAALKEVNRVLKPGARLATSCLRMWIKGQFGRNLADWYSRTWGTNYFRPDVLEPIFKEAGFTDVQCLHEKRYWLLMSAQKPAV